MTTPKKTPAQKVAALLQQSPGARTAAPLREVDVPALVCDLGAMIEDTRKQVAVTADASDVLLERHAAVHDAWLTATRRAAVAKAGG